MTILKYEYLDKEKEYVKTIERDLYGIWNLKNNEEVITPRFKHIFPFDGRLAVAITMRNDFIGITEFGEEIPLSKLIIEEYEKYLIKGSVCNCKSDGCSTCNYLGFIVNQYGLETNI